MPRSSGASGDAATCATTLYGRPVRLQRWPTTPEERLDTGRTQPVRIGAGRCQRWSRRPQDQPEIEISIGLRPDPAGSFLGDFRTPAGARNSSRKRNDGFRASDTAKRTCLSERAEADYGDSQALRRQGVTASSQYQLSLLARSVSRSGCVGDRRSGNERGDGLLAPTASSPLVLEIDDGRHLLLPAKAKTLTQRDAQLSEGCQFIVCLHSFGQRSRFRFQCRTRPELLPWPSA
jgi:hypothetical protein